MSLRVLFPLAIAVVLLAPATVARHDGGEFPVEVVHDFTRGPTPFDTDIVLAECHGDAKSGPCVVVFDAKPALQYGNIFVWWSTCEASGHAETCSDFTGALKVTLRDAWMDPFGRTRKSPDETFQVDYALGLKMADRHTGGDSNQIVDLDSTLIVEVAPALGALPPEGGAWHVWVLTWTGEPLV